MSQQGKVIWDALKPNDPVFLGKFVTSSAKVSPNPASSIDTCKVEQSKTKDALKGGKPKA
jgi:hypothetical protein